MDETTVVEGVQLVGVAVDGQEIVVDLFGGRAGLVSEVAFSVDDVAELQTVVRVLERWEREATPVTVVQGGDGTVTLLDESGTFRSAL